MARGLQKKESQQKALALAKAKQGGKSTLKADKGMKYKCRICMTEVDNITNMTAHYAGKHPKSPPVTDGFASFLKEPAKA